MQTEHSNQTIDIFCRVIDNFGDAGVMWRLARAMRDEGFSVRLIIDEPETHLHPQWIVEYARLIVLLNKQLKIKFFLASHSADMVSAVRYFAEKEGISHDVNFYQANSVNNTYMYAFENLKFDIEPIFNSFNQSFDIVNKYLNDEK